MARVVRRAPALAVPLLATLALATACGSGPDVRVAPGLDCTQDRTSSSAKDVVERVGGLRTDDFSVRLAQSTEAGVVALVDRDVDGAYDLLHDRYGVAIVARITDDGGKRGAADFAQVRELTRDACGATG
jgi:hypothetical protein